MGFRDDFKRWRQEAQKRLLPGGSTDKSAPQTFVSDLIYNEAWERDQDDHLKEVAYKDAVAYYICVKIAENVFDDWFRFVKKIGDEEEIMMDAQKELKRMNAKRWLTEALIGERIYGHSWLYTGPNRFRSDLAIVRGFQIANLDVWTPDNAMVPDNDYDEFGTPNHIRCYFNPQDLNQFKDLPYSDFIQFMTRPKGRSYEGYSAMTPIWDELTYIRLSEHALGWAHMKFGLGVFMWKLTGRLTDDTEAALENALEDLSVMRSFMYDGNLVEDVQFVGPTGSATTNITEGIDTYLGLIAAGSGVPKDIITGTSAGAITGSEINNKALYATLNQIQKSVEPYIRDLIERMGYEEDYEIEWNIRFASDEVEAANARMLNAQADMLEKQAAMGAEMFGQQPAKDPEQDNNPTGEQA